MNINPKNFTQKIDVLSKIHRGECAFQSARMAFSILLSKELTENEFIKGIKDSGGKLYNNQYIYNASFPTSAIFWLNIGGKTTIYIKNFSEDFINSEYGKYFIEELKIYKQKRGLIIKNKFSFSTVNFKNKIIITTVDWKKYYRVQGKTNLKNHAIVIIKQEDDEFLILDPYDGKLHEKHPYGAQKYWIKKDFLIKCLLGITLEIKK